MAFVIEDGTGKADSNSYTSTTEADLYFSDRGITAWAGTPEEKQAWLIQATDYIDGRFGGRFLGATQYTEAPAQSLSFPRIGIATVPAGTIPVNLKKACAEYALRAKSGILAPDLQVDESGFAVQGRTEKVGPIEDTVQFAVGAGVQQMLLRPYPAADMLLRGLVRSTGNGKVIRS